jgi:hypothetical protein
MTKILNPKLTKILNPKRLGHWLLEFGICLLFGACNL